MKTLKTADYIIQWGLITGAILINVMFIFQRGSFEDFFFGSYFVVGGWQVMSVIVHFFLPTQIKARNRKIYQWCLLTILLIGAIMFVASEATIFYLLGLLIVSPFLAVYYAVICTNETLRLDVVPTQS